jgi:hypothetical protein
LVTRGIGVTVAIGGGVLVGNGRVGEITCAVGEASTTGVEIPGALVTMLNSAVMVIFGVGSDDVGWAFRSGRLQAERSNPRHSDRLMI